jgi:hypothetical protein
MLLEGRGGLVHGVKAAWAYEYKNNAGVRESNGQAQGGGGRGVTENRNGIFEFFLSCFLFFGINI